MKTANPTTTSSCMKTTFIILCIILCIVTTILYSTTTIDWKIFNTLLTNRSVGTEKPTENSTVIITTDNLFKIPADQKIPTYSNRRFAIFACSIHSKVQVYTFYTPITAASWKRAGYETIVVFVGDFTRPDVLTGKLNLTRNYLKHIGGHIVDVQCDASYAVKLSQLVRLFAGFLPDSIVHDDDDVLTGDSDLMPLKPKEYIPTSGTDGFIFNAHCCGTFKRRGRSYKMFPMGHIYLKKKAWRAIIMESKQRAELLVNATNQTLELLSANASISFDLISLYARHEFKQIYDSAMTKGDTAWYMDQILCSMLITDFRERHKEFRVTERGRAGRLDRANPISHWNRDKFDQYGDAHLIHDSILQERNWKIFNKLLNALFTENLVQLFNDYYRQYLIVDKINVTPKPSTGGK